MALPKKSKPRRQGGNLADSNHTAKYEAVAEKCTDGSRCSSKSEERSQSRVVSGVLKKFAKRNQRGKFLECTEDLEDVLEEVGVGLFTQERLDFNSTTKSRTSSSQPVPSDPSVKTEDSKTSSESSVLKREGADGRSNDNSIAHEGAVATLVAMFEEPWSEDLLGEVLSRNDNNLTKSVDMILSHGSNPPEDLVKSLSGWEDDRCYEERGESVNVFPRELIHSLEDDISAITVESSMDFPRKERSAKPSHLPIIEDDEYSIEGELERCRQEANEDYVSVFSRTEKENMKSIMSRTGAVPVTPSSTKDDILEDSVDVAGAKVVHAEENEGEDLLEAQDSGNSVSSREEAPSGADEGNDDDMEDLNTIGRLEVKVMRLAGTLGGSSQTESKGEIGAPAKAILIPVGTEIVQKQHECSTNETHCDSQSHHKPTELESLRIENERARSENEALKDRVKDLTDKITALQTAMERMLANQESAIESALDQRREMEALLSEASIARHCEI